MSFMVMGFRVYRENRNGQEVGNYRIQLNRNLSRTLKTDVRSDAKQRAEGYIKAYINKELSNNTAENITLDKLSQEFCETKNNLSENTKRMYELSLNALMLSIGGDKKVSEICDLDFRKFKNDCMAKMKIVSLNSYLNHIRVFFTYAQDQDHIKKIPNEICRVKDKKRLPATFTKQEILNILKVSRRENYEMFRIIKFALWTCCRKEEIRSLKYQDIDFKTGLARIIGKGDKERSIPLTPGALSAIRYTQDIGYVFLRWHPTTISRFFKNIMIKAGIPKNDERHFHNLRHTAATQMLNSNIPLDIVQAMLGHEDQRTTRIYAKMVPKTLVREIRKFNY